MKRARNYETTLRYIRNNDDNRHDLNIRDTVDPQIWAADRRNAQTRRHCETARLIVRFSRGRIRRRLGSVIDQREVETERSPPGPIRSQGVVFSLRPLISCNRSNRGNSRPIRSYRAATQCSQERKSPVTDRTG